MPNKSETHQRKAFWLPIHPSLGHPSFAALEPLGRRSAALNQSFLGWRLCRLKAVHETGDARSASGQPSAFSKAPAMISTIVGPPTQLVKKHSPQLQNHRVNHHLINNW